MVEARVTGTERLANPSALAGWARSSLVSLFNADLLDRTVAQLAYVR